MSTAKVPGDAERLAWVLERLKLTQAELARQMGRSPQYVNNVATGKQRITREFAVALTEAYDLRVGWLLTGEGGPFAESTYTTTPAAEVPFTCADREEVWRCRTCRGFLTRKDLRCPTCEREIRWPEDEEWYPLD